MVIKKKKSFLSVLVAAAVISACVTILLTPILKLVYPLSYGDVIEKSAGEYGLDSTLIMGIISAESNFDSTARSNKDAHGLMQLKDETALWCVENLSVGVSQEDIRKPEANIRIGCAYIRYLIDLYGGNTHTAIAAYNAGLGNVNKWLSDTRYSDGGTALHTIPFSETEAYVEKVERRSIIYQRLYKGEK